VCGACGTPTTGWTERIAPLGAGAAQRRARTLCALVRGTGAPGARLATVLPWPGGALRLGGPGGWRFAPTLLAGAREMTRRHGPLVPVHPSAAASATEVALPFELTPEAMATWCAAVVAALPPGDGPVIVTAAGREITLTHRHVQITDVSGSAPTIRTRLSGVRLAEHWRSVLHPFRAGR
jgi:hypothetical protein